MTRQITTKTILEHFSRFEKDYPIRIYCAFNAYELKNVVLNDDTIVFEAGDINNFPEENPEPDTNLPMIA